MEIIGLFTKVCLKFSEWHFRSQDFGRLLDVAYETVSKQASRKREYSEVDIKARKDKKNSPELDGRV
jgi:hypothetical protein